MFRWIIAGLVLGASLLTLQSLIARNGEGAQDDPPARSEAQGQPQTAPKFDDNTSKDEKPAKPETKAEKAYDALIKGLAEEFEVAETNAEREKLRTTYGKQLFEHAKAHPGDKTALEALLLAVRMYKPGTEGVRKDAYALLNKDYLKTPHLIKKHFKDFEENIVDPDAVKFLQAVVKDNTDKTTRALACQALVKSRDNALQLLAAVNKQPEGKKSLEARLGQAVVKEFLASEADFKKQQADALALLRGDLKGVIPDVMIGATAPAAEATDLKGKKVSLADYKGKVVVVDFWATWCGPCIKMIPDNRKLVKAMKDRPFAFVSISADKEKSAVTDFLKDTDMPWDHWWVGSGSKLQEAWDVEGFPSVFLVDHKGVIRFTQDGYDPDNKLEKEVEQLVKEAEADKKAGKK